jgi:hypothetical protein
MGPVILGLVALYFLPTCIACIRKHKNGESIFATNLLLGWIVLGWIIALIWALSCNVEQRETATQGDQRQEGLSWLQTMGVLGVGFAMLIVIALIASISSSNRAAMVAPIPTPTPAPASASVANLHR